MRPINDHEYERVRDQFQSVAEDMTEIELNFFRVETPGGSQVQWAVTYYGLFIPEQVISVKRGEDYLGHRDTDNTYLTGVLKLAARGADAVLDALVVREGEFPVVGETYLSSFTIKKLYGRPHNMQFSVRKAEPPRRTIDGIVFSVSGFTPVW